MWVGLCLTRWGLLDEIVFKIFHEILHTETKLAAIIYYKSPSLDTRLNLCDELVAAAFPYLAGKPKPQIIRMWNGIREALRKLTPVRNALAHHNVGSMSEIQMVQQEDKIFRAKGSTTRMEIRLNQYQRLRDGNNLVKLVKDEELPSHYDSVQATIVQMNKIFVAIQKELQSKRVQQESQHKA